MELDIEDFAALHQYLMSHNRLGVGETVSFKALQGGVSNRTVRVAWGTGTVGF